MPSLCNFLPMLDDEQRAEFVSQLEALLEKFIEPDNDYDDPQQRPYGLTIAFYPMARAEAETDIDEEHDEQ